MKNWNFIRLAAFDEIDVEFRLDDDYELSYFFKLGTMQNYCTRPKPHILLINSYEPSKKWNLTQEMVFTKYGMINTQFFVQEQSRAKKYYTQVVLSWADPLTQAYTPAQSFEKIALSLQLNRFLRVF